MTNRLPSPQALLTFAAAFLAVLALSRTPFGSLYRTLPGYSAPEGTAMIRLTGFVKPKVGIGVGERGKARYIRVEMEEGNRESLEVGRFEGLDPPSLLRELRGARETEESEETEEWGIAVPVEWKLEEVRGVHVREMRKWENAEMRKWNITFPEGKTSYKFIFTTHEPFTQIAVRHDSPTPALVEVTHVTLPEPRTREPLAHGAGFKKTVQFVEESRVFALD